MYVMRNYKATDNYYMCSKYMHTSWRSTYIVMVGKPQGKRALARPKCRCVSTINMYLKETRWVGVDLTWLVQDKSK
jgi:hypothetical protein